MKQTKVLSVAKLRHVMDRAVVLGEPDREDTASDAHLEGKFAALRRNDLAAFRAPERRISMGAIGSENLPLWSSTIGSAAK